MKTEKKQKPKQFFLSFPVPMGTRIHLNQLQELYEAYRPQVPDFRPKKVNRAMVVRMALAYLYRQAEAGVVGPELLHLTGQDRRVGPHLLQD